MAGDAGFEPTLPGSKPGVATITPIPNISHLVGALFLPRKNKAFQDTNFNQLSYLLDDSRKARKMGLEPITY